MWLRGFFTGSRHAVTDLSGRLDFHGVPIGWSVCNRPVVLEPDQTAYQTRDPVCPLCAHRLTK